MYTCDGDKNKSMPANREMFFGQPIVFRFIAAVGSIWNKSLSTLTPSLVLLTLMGYTETCFEKYSWTGRRMMEQPHVNGVETRIREKAPLAT
jgi:hypothetical protein